MTAAGAQPVIGVLALQGDFAEHVAALARAGLEARPVRVPRDLDGIVAPVGGGGLLSGTAIVATWFSGVGVP